jgi:Tol biopolymer transport system component/DNA-binding winged helix-turn-helix (wHTH) protein
MSEKTGRIYEFGDFRLDVPAKTLLRMDEPIALTPKVFETLQFFVEHAGKLLEKDELMQGIWQDRFVEESNLTFNIKMLRRALQDDAQHPRFIETLPRRGYKFIAPVKEASQNSETTTNTLPTSQVNVKRVYWAIASAIIVALLAFIFAWFRYGSKASATAVPIFAAPFKSEKLSSSGNVHALITPDGKYVAYTNEISGKQSVWLRKLETSENIQIVPPIEGAYLGLEISNDGNSLYFVRRDRTNEPLTNLYRVNTFGGIPVKLSEQVQGWISVSPDDKQVAFVRCKYSQEDYCSLSVVDNDGKNERRLVVQPKPTRITDSHFMHDGRSLVFAAGQSLNGSKDFHLMRVDLASGAISQVSPTPFFVINRIEDLPNYELIFTARESLDGPSRIFHLTSTGEIQALTNDGSHYNDLSLSKLGDKMVTTEITNTFRVQLAALDGLDNPKNLVAAQNVCFAPDGRIIYSSDTGDIWTINSDGSEQRQLTNNTANDFSPRISPVGLYIYFASNRGGSNQIWRMNIDGSNQTQITQREGGFPLLVTPDGKYVYFFSGLSRTMWRISNDSGEESQISSKVVQSPAFASDGKIVAYFLDHPDGRHSLEVMSVETGQILKTLPIEGETIDTSKITWSPDAKSVWYLLTESEQNSLWQLNLSETKPRLVANLGNEHIMDLSMSQDGKRWALVRGKWIHDAVLLEGLK